ncbi:hypothetical protein ACQ4PT_067685 [Festuca glaucescens]
MRGRAAASRSLPDLKGGAVEKRLFSGICGPAAPSEASREQGVAAERWGVHQHKLLLRTLQDKIRETEQACRTQQQRVRELENELANEKAEAEVAVLVDDADGALVVHAMAWSTRLSSSDAAVPASDHDQATLLSRKSSRPMEQLSVLGNCVAIMIVLVASNY